MKLAPSGVDGGDMGRPALQQAVAEAAGGGAHVEAGQAARIDAESVEGRGELHPAARHVRMRRGGADPGAPRDDLGGLGNGRAVGGHEPGLDRRARPGPAVEQAELDQQQVGPLAAHARLLRRLGPPCIAASMPRAMLAASSPASAYMRSGLSWSW